MIRTQLDDATRKELQGLRRATLPPKARVVVVMRYWADLSVDQTAELLGCSPGNVKSQSARALSKLRPMLDDIATESGSPDHSREISPSHSLEERDEARDIWHG